MSIFYTFLAIILLFISILASAYFSFEIYNNLSSYIDVYTESHNK
jgi:uncharacterized membrane protein